VVVVNLDDGILIRRILVELEEGNRFKIVLGIEDDRASA
jgi:hypothetical protein